MASGAGGRVIVGLIILVLAFGAMAVVGLELWVAVRDEPHSFFKAWIAWTPLAMAGLAALMAGAGREAAIWTGLIGGPLAYPIWRVSHYLRYEMGPDPAEEDAKEKARIKYRATDFGSGRPGHEAPAAAPLRFRPGELAVIGFAFAMAAVAYGALYAGGAFAPPPTPRELVTATLEQRGYVAPRVSRVARGGAEACAGTTYYWTAAGAEGGACGREGDDYVTVWVERTWTRPGALSPAAVTPKQAP